MAVLKVSRRGAVQDVRELSMQEDRALRSAFRRFSEPDTRPAGAAVIGQYQRAGAGCWLLCDCLGVGDRPPAFVPVWEAHIRRHYEEPWPMHDLDCDFHRDAAEQRAITRSYVRLPEGKAVPLLARLGANDAQRAPRLTSRSYGRRRGALATLLMQLVEKAELNRVTASGVNGRIGGYAVVSDEGKLDSSGGWLGKHHVITGDATVVDLPPDSGLMIRLLKPLPARPPASPHKE